ncbi:MAG: sulfatase-like hydrolase/transferase, partial [Bacteroidales bacterium]|nr:sulfatase-like hydrolase/transferase [Bacteroidales bacterium]
MGSCTSNQKGQEKTKPNIIFILADDLGYGDLGCYGQELIETPHIDALASAGMKFTQHYSGSPVCAPSRCVLLTGKHSGHAYIRGNDEWGVRG